MPSFALFNDDFIDCTGPDQRTSSGANSRADCCPGLPNISYVFHKIWYFLKELHWCFAQPRAYVQPQWWLRCRSCAKEISTHILFVTANLFGRHSCCFGTLNLWENCEHFSSNEIYLLAPIFMDLMDENCSFKDI